MRQSLPGSPAAVPSAACTPMEMQDNAIPAAARAMVIFFISIYSFPAANQLAVYDIILLEIIIVNRIILFSAYTSAPVRMASFRT